MEYNHVLVKKYKIYKIASKNVFGVNALAHGLIYMFKSFSEYDHALEWIKEAGAKGKEYVILETFSKS